MNSLIEVVADKEATEPKVPSGLVEVSTWVHSRISNSFASSPIKQTLRYAYFYMVINKRARMPIRRCRSCGFKFHVGRTDRTKTVCPPRSGNTYISSGGSRIKKTQSSGFLLHEEFEDTKGIISSCHSKKNINRQCNGQKKRTEVVYGHGQISICGGGAWLWSYRKRP